MVRNTWQAAHTYCSFLHPTQRAHTPHTYQFPYQMAPLWVTFSDLQGHFCISIRYAVSSTSLVTINVGWQSHLRSSWHQQVWLYGSLLMTRTALHALCDSCGHKSDSCGWHAICLCYSYNSRPIFELTQCCAGLSAIAEPLFVKLAFLELFLVGRSPKSKLVAITVASVYRL